MIDRWLAMNSLSMPRQMINLQDTDKLLNFEITHAEKYPGLIPRSI